MGEFDLVDRKNMSSENDQEGAEIVEPDPPQLSNRAAALAQLDEEEETDPHFQKRTSSHIIAIVDMVWSTLEVVMVLLCILPNDRFSWEIAAICLIPNVIQLSGAVLIYKKTERVQDTLILFRSCQLWLFLAFLTICLQAAFITWTTVTGVISTFLVFILGLKFLWRFTAMFFLNEFHNELELACNPSNYQLLHHHQETPRTSRNPHHGSVPHQSTDSDNDVPVD